MDAKRGLEIKLTFFLAKRYLMAKWSLMSTLSIIMICFGVITLITVLSIMNGFHNTYKRKILETNTYHVMIQPYSGSKHSLSNITALLSKNKDIISVVPYYDGEGILKSTWLTRGIVIKALPADVLTLDVGFRGEIKVTDGTFDLYGKDRILLGTELARESGVEVGDFVSILTFRGNNISALQPMFRVLRVTGFFKTGYWEYDKNMAYVSLEAGQALFGIGAEALSIGIKVRNVDKTARVVTWMRNNGLGDAYILTWADVNRVLFEALQNEKVAIGFVVMLIIVSGAFNIIGSLVMTIMDKRREIGILRALGATPSLITRIFVMDGFYMGVLGSVFGIFIGFFLALNVERIFRVFETIVNALRSAIYVLFLLPLGRLKPPPFEILSNSIYYLDGVPVEIRFVDAFVITVLAILISVLAAYYPAKKASVMNPVDTIRMTNV
jgi:lipoprotein-releasing system permease protein